jgi:ABC-type bacteriocin/lantibiotic exporter with double-glycine peptidase domain
MRRAVPDFRQEHDYDCGASAARIAAASWGLGFKTNAEWIEALGTNSQGTLVTRIVACLESFGLLVSVVERMTVDELRVARAPVICPIQGDGGGHYVVVAEVDLQDVHLQDPSRGRVKMPIAEFERGWHDFGVNGVRCIRLGIVVALPEPL